MAEKTEKSVPSIPVDEAASIFKDILGSISSLKSQLTALSHQIKLVEKKVNKKIKSLEKENNKNKNKGNRNPSDLPILQKFQKSYVSL